MISILGCGWYGLALGKALAKGGNKVKGSTTSSERLNQLQLAGLSAHIINLTAEIPAIDESFFECDTLIVSIPPKLRSGDGVNYLAKIQSVIGFIIKYNINEVIYISSTGVYPDSNTVVDETVTPEPNTSSGKILFAAEELFRNHTAFKTTIVRFGGLVGPGRHPGRFFSGKNDIPNGQAPVNLIHLNDCVPITLAILNNKAFGYTFNACSPDHPAKGAFYTQAALHASLTPPQFIDELKDWKIVESVNTLHLLNYKLAVNNWQECFATNCF